ncbi:conserved Plasmodium protein, unknown function [Plasmodium vinckei vinckei]|uniref:Tetratricopeptide repeat protein n=1 Tax=Plasmodium vinckei vinckei TaxID=54757 RepID=A0A449BQN5_PLAVN|nr:conserved Plasmodium protein, unknown function [Plasmodium vinckei vinckei]VEV55732.1 conserved Plasmodium protein, unknown function [Plasmodium vinckei vinckei]
MEYKEKPEGPFIVSFYVTNFTSSDESFAYTIKLTDFYNNNYESNIIDKNNSRKINFSSNYIEIDENSALNDVIEKSISLDIFVNSNDNIICIGKEDIKLFPFLHDQLTITKDVIISYKCQEKSSDQASQYNEENKNSEKEDDTQDGEKKKKKKKKKNSSKNKTPKQEQLLTQNIDARFCITLNINTLIGEYAGRLNYNIMNMKVDGVFNVQNNLEDKLLKKNSLSFQVSFLDLCLNDGKLVKDEESDKWKIVWNQNSVYKYRNVKETEYIYNFLLCETFNINAYLLCSNDGKRQNANGVVEDLSGKFEVNATDLVSNRVINTKYKLQLLGNSKKPERDTKEDKDEKKDEKKNEKTYIFSNSYILLTIQFYKPFLKRQSIESPLNLDCFKNLAIQNAKDVVDKKNENISGLFNNYILNGIELINAEIDKLGKDEHIKIYKMSQEYFNFLNNLKENEKYINLYNNIKNVMIQIMYELINKNIYKNFNLNDYASFKEGFQEESMTNNDNSNQDNKEKKNMTQEKVQGCDNKNNSIDCKSYMSDENINYIYTQLFNIMTESCNVIINSYFEKKEDINNISIKEIKNKNNIKDIEKYLFTIFCENEFLLKNKKNENFAEAILIILFKKIYSFYDYKKKDMEILENHKYNHIINIIENISEEELEGINKSTQNIDQSYIYNKMEEKETKKYFANNTNYIKGLISSIYTKNQNKNNCNPYLIDYVENYDQDMHTKGESEIYKDNDKVEDIISIFNLEQNKEIKNIFTYIIYKYSKILLITNNINQSVKQNNEQEQQAKYTEYSTQNKKNSISTPNYTLNNLEYNDCFEYHANYDSYQKYIQPHKVQSAILSLSTYIQLTNFENIESILMLSLLYLNTQKYDEAIEIANYLIEILQTNKSEDKNKEEMDMKSLYLHSSFNYNNIFVSKEICIYIKAICYFFKRNYIYYYINMNIILNTNENVIQKEIEKNSNFFKNEKFQKTTYPYVYANTSEQNELNEINLQKVEKNDKKNLKKKKNKDKEDCSTEKKNPNENTKEQKDDTSKRLDQDNENVDNRNEYDSKNNPTILNNIEKEKEKKTSKKKEENLSVVKKITINCSEVNINDIPLKDKFMILFLIYCLNFNILNIVMYIYENNKMFLSDVALKTSLYRQLIIRLFFSLKDFTKCIKIIDETKEYNNNLDILYIYAESLYKLKDYKKSITYFKEYLDLCVHDNIRARIYIQLSKAYICLNQYEDSKTMIKNSLEINKTSYAYLYFSYYYFKKKKYIYAYKLLYKSNEINIFNHKIWASLSIILLHLNMKNEADKCLNNFIKMKKYKKETVMEIIEAYKELGYEASEKQLLNFLSQQINENCGE